MQLCNEAHDYATRENATKALVKALEKVGLTLGDVRWLIAVHAGTKAPGDRFVPVIVLDPRKTMHLALPLASLGISVIN